MKANVTLVTNVVTVLAAALWFGGMIALGAIVAPVVFGVVPMPTSADAMTVVFRRFDVVAMACAVILLAGEGWRLYVVPKISRLDFGRAGTLAIATVLAGFEGLVVAPRVAELHAAGAIRGVGDMGERLEAAHLLAERTSKWEAILVVAFVILFVRGVTPRSDPGSEDV
ncbi:MAG TPA: DUF4149 domain-containing protein [Polyangiaceae bacterium]